MHKNDFDPEHSEVKISNMNNLNVPVDTKSLDEIRQAAFQEYKEKGPLVVKAGGDAQAQWDSFRALWKSTFPEIELDLVVDFSKYHDSRADRAFYEGGHYADICFLQTLHDFPRWKEQNRLLYYKPPNFEQIYADHKDLDGAFTGIALWSFGRFLYDHTKVAEEDVPKNFLDVLDPKWKGKMVLTWPNDDDMVAYLFAIIVSRYGFGWLEKLKEQDVLWVRGTATCAYIIHENHDVKTAPKRIKEYMSDNNQRVLSFTTAGYPMDSPFLQWKDPEAPEQYITWTQTAGIFSSTPRPQLSKLFMAWITGDAFQGAIGETGSTVMKNIDRKTGNTIHNSNTTQIGHGRTFMNDRRMMDWWKMQYETTLGTAQGPSPMDVYDFNDIRNL